MLIRVMTAALMTVLLSTGLAFAKEEYTEMILQDMAVAIGDGRPMPVDRYTSVAVDLYIATTATVTFEGSVKGELWSPVACLNANSGSAGGTSATVTGVYQCNVAGFKTFRTPVSAWTSGAVSSFARATTAPSGTGGSSILGSVWDAVNNALRVTMVTLLAGEDQTNNLIMTSGGKVRSTTMATAVTTNTTSAAVPLPVGSKSIYGSVTGTGSVSQTQKIYGGITSGVTSTTGILLCTLTLSGTTAAYDACPVMTANYLFYIVVTSATTGTGASGVVTAMY